MAERSTKKIYLSVLVTLLLLIFFHYLGWFNWPEKIMRQITIGALAKVHSIGVSAQKHAIIPDQKLECKN